MDNIAIANIIVNILYCLIILGLFIFVVYKNLKKSSLRSDVNFLIMETKANLIETEFDYKVLRVAEPEKFEKHKQDYENIIKDMKDLLEHAENFKNPNKKQMELYKKEEIKIREKLNKNLSMV